MEARDALSLNTILQAEDKQPQSAPALSTHPADSTEDILLPSLIPDALSPASHVYTNQPTEDKVLFSLLPDNHA